MNPRNTTSIIRILWVDLWAGIGAGLIIGSAVFLAIHFIFPHLESYLFETSLTVLVIGVPIMTRRIFSIMGILKDAQAVQGILNSVWFIHWWGRVEYIYSFRGQKYQGGNAIFNSRFTQDLEIGNKVTIVIDRNNPKRAYIQDLYT